MLELFFFRIALCKPNNASNFFNERIFKGLKIHMDAIIHILVVCMCHMCISSLSAFLSCRKVSWWSASAKKQLFSCSSISYSTCSEVPSLGSCSSLSEEIIFFFHVFNFPVLSSRVSSLSHCFLVYARILSLNPAFPVVWIASRCLFALLLSAIC